MNFLMLQDYPAIKPEYLKHLKDQWIRLLPYWSKYDSHNIQWIIVRTGVEINKQCIDSFPSLKYICRVGVWLNNIDIDYAQKQWIRVINTPGANADAVADMAVCGAIMLERKIMTIQRNIQDNLRNERFTYVWSQLSWQTVGIFWFWHIGKKIYQRLIASGVQQFIIIDPHISEKESAAFRYCTKGESLEKSISTIDTLFITVPLLPSTENIINKSLLAKAKETITLINCSRGWIINEQDLYQFLSNNLHAWAYLDVRIGDPKPTPSIKQLASLHNCIVTPHIAGVSHESEKAMHQFTIT